MRRLWIPAMLLLCQAVPGQAETDETAAEEPTDSEIAAQEAIEADTDGSLDDAEGSIEITEVQRGFSLTSDVRTVYSHSDTDNRDNSNTVEDVLRARWRLRGTVGIFDYLRASTRVWPAFVPISNAAPILSWMIPYRRTAVWQTAISPWTRPIFTGTGSIDSILRSAGCKPSSWRAAV